MTRDNEQRNYTTKIIIDSVPPPIDSSAYVLQKLADYESEINLKLDTLESLADKKLEGYELSSPDKKFIYAEERDIAIYLDSLGQLVDLNEKKNYVEEVDYKFYSGYNGEVNDEVESLNKIFFAKEIVETEKEAKEKLAILNKEKTSADNESKTGKKSKDSADTTSTTNEVAKLDNSFKDVGILNSIKGVKVLDDHTIVPPIYFNFNDDQINKFSEKSMKKVLKFMKKNDDVMLEIRSHTDCRGEDIYNVRLSERRSQNSALYIINKGIFLGRIRAKGLGETELINDCDCDAKGLKEVNCTEAHHRENRRSEFVFFKIDPIVSKESVLDEE